MNDERMIGRPALERVDALDGGAILGYGAEPIYRFSGKGRDAASAQLSGGGGGVSGQATGHGCG